MKNYVLILLCSLLAEQAQSQMWNGVDSLYGNEWVSHDKPYYRIRIGEEGLYRIPQALLAGTELADKPAAQLRLFAFGQQVAIHTTTEAVMGGGDFIEFYADKNRDQLDRYLFDNADKDNVNPRYSMFQDTASYYLTWDAQTPPLRITALANVPSTTVPPVAWCWSSSEQVFSSALAKKVLGSQTYFSWFDGNGYASTANTSNSASLTLPNLYANGPEPSVQLRYACSLDSHFQQILVNDQLLATDKFYGWQVRQGTYTIPVSLVSNGAANVRVSSEVGGIDRNYLAWARVRYPRSMDFGGANSAFFELPPSSGDQNLEIANFNASGQAPVLFDLTHGRRLVTVVENGLVKALLPPASTTTRLFLVNADNGVRTVSTITRKDFPDFKSKPFDYLIISNSALYGGGNQVQEYADYRASAAGGNHAVLVADVYDLYEQFAYGVQFHPLSIRNFLHWAKKQFPQFEHVLLMGKALDYTEFRSPAAQAQYENKLFFVPTYSSPGADMPFTLRGNRLSDPVVAIGRLAVTTPADIAGYLSKVKEHEQVLVQATQDVVGKSWMKRVLHNSGGDASERVVIKGYTSGMAQILENNRFGATTSTFFKTSNDPIQLSSYEQILNLVNGGVSVWSIFGHSSANAVDFDIGAPENYNNKGRYPFMMVMGCLSGIASNVQDGLGERFVLAKDKGVIAYVASVNYSFINSLNTYAQEYYRHLGGEAYGKSIGTAMRHTVSALKGTQYSDLIAVLHQNLIQGDPAIRLNLSSGPDYTLDPATVTFSPNPISLEENRVALDMDVVNLGENTQQDLVVKVEQRLPNGSTVFQRILDTIPAPANRNSLHYDLDLQGSSVGFNRFFVRLDPANAVAELPLAAAEMNNNLADASGAEGQDLYIFAEDIQPVWPPKYGIVGSKTVTLSASTLNTSATQTRYLFEMDTIETFDSPLKKTTQITQMGGLLRWQVPMPLADSTVYYWRVARDSLVNGVVAWRTRSFLHLQDAPYGWNQSHYGQFRDNDFSNMLSNDSLRRLEFVDNASFSNISVAYRDQGRYPGLYNAYSEGMRGDYGFNVHGLGQGVLVAVSDPANGRYWFNPIGGPFSFDPPKDRYYFWFFTSDSLQRTQLMGFLENVVPDGHYVSFLATGRPTDSISYGPRLWAMDSVTYGKNLFQLLEAQGAKRVRKLTDFVDAPPAYGLFYRKGSPGFQAIDTINADPDASIEMRASFLAKWPSGHFETKDIGPAKQWTSLHWERVPFDDGSDQSDLFVYGVRPVEGDTLFFSLKNTFDTTLAAIDAKRFPYLKIRHETLDTVPRTVTALRYLRVLYDGQPEAALTPTDLYQFYADTLQQGEALRAAVSFANVSSIPMDSLLVRYKVDGPGNADLSVFRRYRPLPPGDSLHLRFEAPTLGMEGPQRLFIDANADNDQAEAYHFNNVLTRDFYVGRDRRNPLLDVTFDGQHILDGDLISPKPEVVITLKDDNRYLAMQDTATFSLSLLMPDGNTVSIAHSDPTVQFFPADPGQLSKKNLARLEWRPEFVQDGEYRLLVNGRDASGNESAKLDWSLTFNVITKSSLSNVLNYPNPFSTSTCFYYTMTGAEPPSQFKLQIMTVSGRVVREVTEAEFGPLRAGRQRSDFCWDGRDQYGDQLANGVYLYRITAKKSDGTAFEFFENNQVDGYFKHGFGKMVLLR